VINGVAFPLTLDVGIEGQGNYFFEDTTSSGCREYFFYFKDANGKETFYPETGSLLTFQEGSCAQAFKAAQAALPSNIDNVNAPGGAAGNVGAVVAGVLIPLILIAAAVIAVVIIYKKKPEWIPFKRSSAPKSSAPSTLESQPSASAPKPTTSYGQKAPPPVPVNKPTTVPTTTPTSPNNSKPLPPNPKKSALPPPPPRKN
jgi:hypothetical protein